MSNPKPNDAEGKATGRAHKHTRSRSRDEADDEEKQPAAPSSAHVSPAMRIYRHALESICGMLELGDLSRVLAVSRSWSAAVRSMTPTHAVISRDERASIRERNVFRPLPRIARIIRSPLLRHLAAIQISGLRAAETSLTNESIDLLAQHAPNLNALWCKLSLTPNEPLTLPPKLQLLELELAGMDNDDVIDGVLTTLAALSSLSCLRLRLLSLIRRTAIRRTAIQWSILAACPSLTNLTLETRYGTRPRLSTDQLEQIRLNLGHLQRFSVGRMETDMLEHLLKPPVTARWRDIGRVEADARTGDLLLRLQTLTKLDLSYRVDTPPVFLGQLQHLSSLELDCDNGGGWFIPADALLASLVRCTSLFELNLSCRFDSAHWSALLAKLTALRKLTIGRGSLKTLQCFPSSPIAQSLEELSLEYLKLPPAELSHLYALRGLRSLHLRYCFSPRLHDDTIDSLSPPTANLPMLTKFVSRWHSSGDGDDEDGEDESVDRQGPSFEWMQARQAM